MKKKYDGYPKPSNENPVRHTDEYYDDIEYYNKFYNDKEYHITRVTKGKKIRNTKIGKIALNTVLAGAIALGTIVHGTSYIHSIFYNMPSSLDDFVIDIFAILLCSIAGIRVKFCLTEDIKSLAKLNTDIKVSKQMIKVLSKNKEIEKTK